MRNRFIFEEKEGGFALHYRRTAKDWFDLAVDFGIIFLLLATCATLPLFMLADGLEWGDLAYVLFPLALYFKLQASWPRISSRTNASIILDGQSTKQLVQTGNPPTDR